MPLRALVNIVLVAALSSLLGCGGRPHPTGTVEGPGVAPEAISERDNLRQQGAKQLAVDSSKQILLCRGLNTQALAGNKKYGARLQCQGGRQ